MKRKTNLFYTEGEDSKFITFSNYTEALTGNFLSTDTKLFPSKFLCLKLEQLYNQDKTINTEEKTKFIQYLVSYYESKLAVLRDIYVEENKNSELLINPLYYLLEAINKYTQSENEIVYASDIVEQDYNGTYTDTICLVDMNDIHSGKIANIDTPENLKTVEIDIPKYGETECLYGWEFNEVPAIYNKIKTEFDQGNLEIGSYTVNPLVECKLTKPTEEINELSFNIIIPLFDVTNINYKTNDSTLADINLDHSSSIQNVPLGMWFADETITLKKDDQTGFAQSWSLAISSQFKPFPYSKSIPNEVTNSSKSNSFATFAQVLSKQNQILDEFSKMSVQIADLSKRLSDVEGKFNQIGTLSNIDNLHQELLKYEQETNSRLLEFKKEILSYVDDIKWKTTI